MGDTFIVFLLIFAVGANGLWYFIKYTTHQRGYKANFWNHWQDIGNMHDLIKREKNPSKKHQYQVLLFSLYLALALLFGFFFLFPLLSR